MWISIALLALCVAVPSLGRNHSRLIDEFVDRERFQRKMLELSEVVDEMLELSEELQKAVEEMPFHPPHSAEFVPGIFGLNARSGVLQSLYEGDIALTEEQLDELQVADGRNKSRGRRQAQTGRRFPTNTWMGRPIPFSFADDFPADRIPFIRAAIDFWQTNTCVRFAEGAPGSDRVEFVNDDGCYSYVGRIGGKQAISIGDGCAALGKVAHELAHTIGLFHVQARYDRDRYVAINKNNVNKDFLSNFDKESAKNTNNYDIPYEFGSNMHYGELDFATDGAKPVLVALGEHKIYQHSMGSFQPTFYDVLLVNKYYNCFDKCSGNSTVKCSNGGVVDVNDCSKCRCPIGFGGRHCTEKPEGCSKVIHINATSSVIKLEIGQNYTSEQPTFEECTVLLKTDKGKRIRLEPRQLRGVISSNCEMGGVEVRFKNETTLAGLRLCNMKLHPPTIVSEGNRMVLHYYNALYTTHGEFRASAVNSQMER